MRKIIELDERFAGTGEATVQTMLLWTPSGKPSRERSKHASEASDYLHAVTPQPGKTIVLVIALGSMEAYSSNRNGDSFNARPYRNGQQALCGCCKAPTGGWITEEETLPHHYKSFESGKIFRHHQNRCAEKNIGDVIKAFWNAQMQRVELLLGVDNARGKDVTDRIADGEFPAVSMGCRISEDRCSVCCHRAPTRAQYCDHLKYHMREVSPSGVVYSALNPSPRFFDISFVSVPADRTGYMMARQKVAEAGAYEIRTSATLGDYLDAVDEKRAAIQKVSDIDKVIRGIPVDHKTSPLTADEGRVIERYRDSTLPHVVRGMPDIDDGTLKSLAAHPIQQVLSTLSAAGIILTTPEFVKLLVERLSPGTVVPEEALDAIVALQGHVFDYLAEHPQALDQMADTGLFDINASNVRPEIAAKAEKYLEKRSTISEYLSRAMIPQALRAEEPPWTDSLHVTDPSTGDQYATTRGAAARAHDAIAKKQVTRTIGGAALLAGGYKLLAPGIPSVMRPLAMGTAAAIGYKHLKPNMGPQYQTDEGVNIPTLTELQKTSSDRTLLPVLGSAALVTALGHDYDSRLRRGEPVGDPNAPVHRRLLDRMGAYTSEHPALSFLGGLAAYGVGKGMAQKFAAFVGAGSEGVANDAVTLPTMDVDKIAEKLGSVLFR